MAEEKVRGQRKTRIGFVVGDKAQKSAVVAITRRYMHKKYKKYVKKRERYQIHDPENQCAIGDKVLIEECRPLSKHKRWKLKEIIEKAPLV